MKKYEYLNIGRNLGGYLYRSAMPYIKDYGQRVLGYTQYRNTQASLSAQIDYEQYLKAANERAYKDWRRNVNRPMAYPELSYPGQIRRADTSIARAGFDYDTSYSNYVGNFPYRTAGLYGIAGKLSRSL